MSNDVIATSAEFFAAEQQRWVDATEQMSEVVVCAQAVPGLSGVGFTGLDANLATEFNGLAVDIRNYLRGGPIEFARMGDRLAETERHYRDSENQAQAAATALTTEVHDA